MQVIILIERNYVTWQQMQEHFCSTLVNFLIHNTTPALKSTPVFLKLYAAGRSCGFYITMNRMEIINMF